ncbi:MAG: hypothetical protein QG656_182 [Candidatus Hydrogenedentes bacterium]|nr:hypothetical protein [Candidatus Hydrogenedentota bacterium]
MTVYRYNASVKHREGHTETGTVVARDEAEAREKLKPYQYDRIVVKRLTGFESFFGKFTADVK